MKSIRLAIVEDDVNIRESLVTYMGDSFEIDIAFAVDSVEAFLAKFEVSQPPEIDVLVLDIGLPGMTGLEGISHIKSKIPSLDIIMLTTFEEEEKIFKALCAGAVSYISKRTALSKIKEAIITISRGGAYMSPSIAKKVINYFNPKKKTESVTLTPRQQQIAQGIIDGLSYKMIADKYMITQNTVRDHIKKIYKLLEINSSNELIKRNNETNLLG